MRRYKDFDKVSEALSDLLTISKILFSADLLDIIRSRGLNLKHSPPSGKALFLRFEFEGGVAYALICCEDEVTGFTLREGRKWVPGAEGIRRLKDVDGVTYVYGVSIDSLPEPIRSEALKAISECRKLTYPNSLLGTQLYGFRVGSSVLIKSRHYLAVPAEREGVEYVLILPSEEILEKDLSAYMVTSMALDFTIAVRGGYGGVVVGAVLPRYKYSDLNELIAMPPALILRWSRVSTLAGSGGGKATSSLLKATRYIARAHSMGLPHLWLDPSKVLIGRGREGREGTVVLGFLGRYSRSVARLVDERYGDPYAFVGMGSARSDVYSLGMMFIESLTGRVPKSYVGIATVMKSIATGTPRSLESVNESLIRGLRDAVKGGVDSLINYLSKLDLKLKKLEERLFRRIGDAGLRKALRSCVSLNLEERFPSAQELYNVLSSSTVFGRR